MNKQTNFRRPPKNGTQNKAPDQSIESAYKIGDLLEVEIKKIVPGGYGLAFAESLTVFVVLAVTGDKVQVRLNEIKGKTAFAEIETIIEPGSRGSNLHVSTSAGAADAIFSR